MNIETNKPYMVFRKDGNYGAMYSIGVSKKNQDGSYTNGYIPARFRKDVELENKTNIYIKKAWLDFYLTKEKKETKVFIFINEFEKVEDTIERVKEETKETDPFKEFSQEADLSELDSQKMELPF